MISDEKGPLSSRPELSTTKKISGNRTRYQPLEMTDESVYDLARHYYTLEEIAERFNVGTKAVLDLHGDAYREGKGSAMQKPRMLLNKIFDDFSHEDINFAHPEFAKPVGNLLKAIELHAKKYEGMGQKLLIEGSAAVKYDAVQSQVQIIEKPEENSDED